MVAGSGGHSRVGASGHRMLAWPVFPPGCLSRGRSRARGGRGTVNTPNSPTDPHSDGNDAMPGTELAPKVYDAEVVTDEATAGQSSAVGRWTPTPRRTQRWRRCAGRLTDVAHQVWRSDPAVR